MFKKYIDKPKFTQTAKSNLENKDSKTGVLNLQGCKNYMYKIIYRSILPIMDVIITGCKQTSINILHYFWKFTKNLYHP